MSAPSGGGGKARTKRTKSQTAESAEEAAPPKKIRKVKTVPAPTQPVPPPRSAEPALLGSLPLYGEELPDGGYENIPPAAKRACAELRDVFRKIHELRAAGKDDVSGEKVKGLVLFASVRRLNRLSHLYCKDTREQTQEQKLEVDDLHLQLQNLKYEAMHLRREISNCLEFRSAHEDIELVEEKDFYSQAPETISKPDVSRTNEHQRMLCRLEWELEQRKQLSQQQEVLEKQIATGEQAIKQNEEKLDGLQPALDSLQKATQPLQEMLGLPLDKMKEEESLAQLLPEPLYILYVQARGYAEVEDKSLYVSLVGDADEAKAFQSDSVSSNEDSDDDSGESESEGGKETESDTTQKQRPKRKSTSEAVDVSKAHPLSVKLTFKLKKVGTFELMLSYLPHFAAVCVLVTVATMEDPAHKGSSHLDKSMLLSCLFEGDSGRVSPNTVVTHNIRRHGGDVFSTAVRQYGFPYKWVQTLCGISVLTTGAVEGEGGGAAEWGEGVVRLRAEMSVENMSRVMTGLRRRFRAQVNLVRQIVLLEEGHTEEGEVNEEVATAAGALTPQSQLVRWKSVTLSEVQSLQFGSEVIFNLQDRTNRFFLATLQHGQDPYSVKLHCLVCLTTNYPTTPPLFAIRIQTSAKKKEPHNIHVKNIEAQVNLHLPGLAPADSSGRSLLTRQVHRLRECLDQHVSSSRGGASASHNIRGKGRLVTFS